MTDIIKDVGEIWSRLFDHRPFLNGEINFFLKEFEEKRSDHEVENLFSTLEIATDIKDTHIPRGILAAESHLPAFIENIQTAINLCDKIVDIGHSVDLAKQLEENRENRKAEWVLFVDDMTHKCSRIDNTFEEKEEELKDFYSDLERKLHIHK